MSKLNPRQHDALEKIEQKPALQPFFFKKLKGLKWFDELENRGFFNPKLNPRPVQSDQEGFFRIPSWPILDYLDQTAPELQQPENSDYADKFLKVMRDVTRNAMADGFGNYQTWWRFAKIVNFIPIDKVTEDDVELFEYWLKDRFDRMLVGIELGEKLLPSLLNNDSNHDRKLAKSLVNALTSLTWHPRRWGKSEDLECSLPVEDNYSSRIFRAHARAIGERLEEAGVSIFRDRLHEIFSRSGKDKYSTIWRPAIEDHKQNMDIDDVENILVSAFRDALLGYVDRRAATADGYVSELLASETMLFRRVAIHVVNVYNKPLEGLTKKLIDPQYFTYHYQHEMYHMLQNCFSGFDEKDKQKVLSIVESVAEQSTDPEQPEDIQKKQQAYTLLRWLSAIRGKGYQKAEDLYTKNLKIAEVEPEHPDFSSYMEDDDWSGQLSPYSVEELLSRDFDNLANILRYFKEEDGWETPSRRGLAQTLREALKARPELFKGHLTELIGLDFDYTYYLIDGYKGLWIEKQYDNWKELLEFCLALLQSEGFWLKDAAEQRGGMAASSGWIVGAISELIKAGTADDKTAFDPAMLPMAERIIVHILKNQEGESFTEERDAVSVAINSPRGKCIEALINYALRLCRLSDKRENSHDQLWAKDLQPMFDEQMMKIANGNLEFVTLFVNYIPNLLYLSRSWTMKQLPILFKKENKLRWLCAMQGYTYVNRIYNEIYRFLSENSHFKDALDTKELGSRGKDKIIQNIVIAYIKGNEQLHDKDGILSWLIERWKLEELRELTWFVWSLRGGKREYMSTKLIPLWVELSRRANPYGEAGKRILSRLCMWSAFVDELSEQTMDLLLQAAPYADLEHHAYILIEELKRLVEQYPDQVAEIFIRMLNDFAPTYKQADIEHIISKLYDNGGENRLKANTICDRYVEYGIGFPAKIRARYSH
jgi:hypothetical protein